MLPKLFYCINCCCSLMAPNSLRHSLEGSHKTILRKLGFPSFAPCTLKCGCNYFVLLISVFTNKNYWKHWRCITRLYTTTLSCSQVCGSLLGSQENLRYRARLLLPLGWFSPCACCKTGDLPCNVKIQYQLCDHIEKVPGTLWKIYKGNSHI